MLLLEEDPERLQVDRLESDISRNPTERCIGKHLHPIIIPMRAAILVSRRSTFIVSNTYAATYEEEQKTKLSSRSHSSILLIQAQPLRGQQSTFSKTSRDRREASPVRRRRRKTRMPTEFKLGSTATKLPRTTYFRAKISVDSPGQRL